MARWDHEKVQQVLDWPIREILLCYVARLKSEALHDYQAAMIAWSAKTAMGGKSKPPELPSILKEQ